MFWERSGHRPGSRPLLDPDDVGTRTPAAAEMAIDHMGWPGQRLCHPRRDRNGHDPVPTAGHLTSWARLAPGIKESAGKKNGKDFTGHADLASILGNAAAGAAKTEPAAHRGH
jgi:hypothetical protein